jgi:tRNA1(Val) A37 N6-methylase TrmN6
MKKADWFKEYSSYYRTNGYSTPPWHLYDLFLEVVSRPGAILELGCGNGLLLRYLYDHSNKHLLPYGLDIRTSAIEEAKRVIFPERAAFFLRSDLRQDIPFNNRFSTIIANPIYADKGYYEQKEGRLQSLYLDGSIEDLISRCYFSLDNEGVIVLWCYNRQIEEIGSQAQELEKHIFTSCCLKIQRIKTDIVVFWLGCVDTSSR